MKKISVLFFVFISAFARAQYAAPCGEVPELNKEILHVLQPHMGKKIGRGECWDAVQLALNTVGADWDGFYVFGRVYDPKKECIRPGDILQFEKVEVEVDNPDGSGYSETFYHHTAIVYAVKGAGELEILHQNNGTSGKKMGVSPLSLKTVTKGKITFFRPVKK